MAIDPSLLEILACPICKAELVLVGLPDRLCQETRERFREKFRGEEPVVAEGLRCSKCGRIYPIVSDIPVMLVEEATVDRVKAAELVLDDIIPRTAPVRNTVPFSATYFPWSVILDPQLLKRTLLYFEKLYILAPPASVIDEYIATLAQRQAPLRSPDFRTPERESFIRFFRSIEPLRKAGVVELLDTNDVLSSIDTRRELEQLCVDDILCDYGLPIRRAALLEDVLSPRSRGAMLHAVEISRDSVPIVQYWDASSVAALYDPILARVREHIRAAPASLHAFLESHLEPETAVVRALLLNASLRAIHQANSVPVLDSAAEFAYLNAKYRRMLDAKYQSAASRNTASLYDYVRRIDTRSGLLASITLDILLPNIAYDHLEDVLQLRERFRDHLEAFRLIMMRLAADIKATVADPEFVSECKEVVTATIMPELLELQRSVRLSRLKVFGTIARKAMSLKPTVPFIISAFTPLPLYAAALVSAGVITLDVALETYLERQKLVHNNGLAYLLDVSPSAIKLDQNFWSRSAALG